MHVELLIEIEVIEVRHSPTVEQTVNEKKKAW